MTEKLTVRAALDAARDRAPIGLDEAVTLLSCAGDDLVELQSIAGALRDEGLAAVGLGTSKFCAYAQPNEK